MSSSSSQPEATDDQADFLAQPPYKEILTPRLVLRTLSLDDAEASLPILSSPQVMHWTRLRETITEVSKARRWLSARCLGADVFNFGIELRSSKAGEGSDHEGPSRDGSGKALVGIMGSYGFPEIGYLMNPAYFGHGYATEALSALIPPLFERMPDAVHGGFDYIQGGTDIDNVPSQRVMLKAGLQLCESTEDDMKVKVGDDSRGTLTYRIARPGRTLQELGLLSVAHGGRGVESRPAPPVE